MGPAEYFPGGSHRRALESSCFRLLSKHGSEAGRDPFNVARHFWKLAKEIVEVFLRNE